MSIHSASCLPHNYRIDLKPGEELSLASLLKERGSTIRGFRINALPESGLIHPHFDAPQREFSFQIAG